jgi:hypothetical protein
LLFGVVVVAEPTAVEDTVAEPIAVEDTLAEPTAVEDTVAEPAVVEDIFQSQIILTIRIEKITIKINI